MEIQVVIINGSGRAGKDEFIKMVEEELNHKVHVFNYSTIDTAKIVGSLLDCPINEKTDKARNLWSSIKDASIVYNNKPANDTIDFVRNCKNSVMKSSGLIFIHCREPEEIKKICDGIIYYSSHTYKLLVKRLNHTVPNCEKDYTENIFRCDYDQIILNTSIDELKTKAKMFTNLVRTNSKREF